jgi:hypothetical protein
LITTTIVKTLVSMQLLQMLALFTAIEMNRNLNSMVMVTTSNFSVKTDNRRKRELKRLAYSINYDVKGEQSNKDKGNGKGIHLFNEA